MAILAVMAVVAAGLGFALWRRRRKGGGKDPFDGRLDADPPFEEAGVPAEDDWEIRPVRRERAQARGSATEAGGERPRTRHALPAGSRDAPADTLPGRGAVRPATSGRRSLAGSDERDPPRQPDLFTAPEAGPARELIPTLVASRDDESPEVAELGAIVPGAPEAGRVATAPTAGAPEGGAEQRARAAPVGLEPSQRDAPEAIVAVSVMARPGRRFVGAALRAALESVGMRFGEMDIYHYRDDAQGPVVFSAANVLKPGTLDLARPAEFATTGIALFMAARPGANAQQSFSVMLETARHLAERLGGELCDGARRVLTAKRIEELRATLGPAPGAAPGTDGTD